MSKSYLKKTFATIALLLSFSSLSAMPAKRTPMVKKQPDGTTVTVRLMGDEHFHYYLSFISPLSQVLHPANISDTLSQLIGY